MSLSPIQVNAIHRLCSRTTQCFTLLIWISKVAQHIRPGNNDGTEIIVMIRNAVTETSLISFRCLNEFFRPRGKKHRNDDVIAEDFFAYKSEGTFLSDEEITNLNKRLLHLTYQEEALDGLSWKIANWTEKGIPRVLEFFRFLAERLPPNDPVRVKLEMEMPQWESLVLQTAQLALIEGSVPSRTATK